MIVAPLRPGGTPLLIDEGGDLIRLTMRILGRASSPSGIPAVITPRWSPDGRWIGFLKRVGNTVQVWRSDTTRRSSMVLTASDVDVEDFRIAPDGKLLIYTSRPGLRKAKEELEREGWRGFHYDDRFAPIAGARPFIPDTAPVIVSALNLATGAVTPATNSQAALLQRFPTSAPRNALGYAVSTAGRRAWMEPSPDLLFPPMARLVAEDQRGKAVICAGVACRAWFGSTIWWNRDGTGVRYLRRAGWGDSLTAIYEWTPGKGAPRRLYVTQDSLIDCQANKGDLICAQEQSLHPRRMVRIDPKSGRVTPILELNPEFGRLELGRVERLQWLSPSGVQSYGDLVYPAGYRPGRRYPLIVVQYESRGFLRGGTGDEVPIQAFANRGYAVLSYQRPAQWALTGPVRDETEMDRKFMIGFAGRRSILSSIESGVRLLLARGIADGDRVGITGLSDGSSTVQFAALNSKMFAAASVSGCCWRQGQNATAGPAIARLYEQTGWPKLTEQRPDFWSQISLVQHPERVAFPILVQASDDEYLSALDSYTALREVGAPIDMFVFPNERHVKWYPSHRLAVYERNLAWFDFWLMGLSPAANDSKAEGIRWADLKAQSGRRQVPSQ
jgi:dipeptidyl aminopeptidase/acylaminoacyl peptidase